MRLQTQRLLIRSFGRADIPAYAEITADPRVMGGWRYAHRHWGRGCATEAATAVLAYGVGTLELRGIVAVAYEANVGSVRVIEKLGFEYVETLDDPRGPIVKYAQPRSRLDP